MNKNLKLLLFLILLLLLTACEVSIGDHVWIRYTGLIFSPTELENAKVGQPYQAKITVSNNDTPVFKINGVDLPQGFSLEYEELASTAYLIGVPEVAGEYQFTIRASCLGTNKNGQTGNQLYQLVVEE
jgi:hypothetical protein